MKKNSGVALCVLLIGFFIGKISTKPSNPQFSKSENSEKSSAREKGSSIQSEPPSSKPSVKAGPNLSEISGSTLKKLRMSCLDSNLILDPMLMELAGLTKDQFDRLQALILTNQVEWAKNEALRSVAMNDPDSPAVIIPPLSDRKTDSEELLKNEIKKICGDENFRVTWSALSPTLLQMTGNFGRFPKIVTFENSQGDPDDISYIVRIKTFEQFSDQELTEIQDWTALSQVQHISRMTSFSFKKVPPFLAPFIER